MKISECYGILNVTPRSEWSEIKRSYRFLARKYHPDVYFGGPRRSSKFRKIIQAFKTLEVSYKIKASGNKYFPPRGKAHAAKNPGRPATPYKTAPIRLQTFKDDEILKGKPSKKVKTLRHILFEWEKSLFHLDIKKNIKLEKRNPSQTNIIRVRKGDDAFQVKVPPGPWTCMFIRIPHKGNKSMFSKKYGDLLLNIQVPGDETLTPPNPVFAYKIRIPRESVGTRKVWTLKSANGPIRFTPPKSVVDGQKFILRPTKSGTASHIITINLV